MNQFSESARRRMQSQAAGEHPDADLLTAFAEQALSGTERERVLVHLAACAVCRDVVTLAAPGPATVEVAAPAAHSWFRWPILRWTAVAATVIVVGAAVSVLVPRREARPTAATVPPTTTTASRDENAGSLGKLQKSEAVATAKPAAPAPLVKTDEVAAAPARSRIAPSPVTALHGAAGVAGSVESKEKAANEIAKAFPMAAPVPVSKDGEVLDDKAKGAVIAGKVIDPSGAVVPNALVKITNARTNQSAAARTDASGAYKFEAVAPGSYLAEATAPGMQNTRTQEFDARGKVEQDLTLRPGTMAETVTVTAAAGSVAQANAAPQTLPSPPPPAAASDSMQALRQNAPVGQAVGGALAMKKADIAGTVEKWRISDKGAVERTADGKTWEKIEIDPAVTFRAISSTNGDLWAGGTGGALFHSADRGRTWSRVKVGVDGVWVSDAITDVSWMGPRSIMVMTQSGALWTTQDSGFTWRRRQ